MDQTYILSLQLRETGRWADAAIMDSREKAEQEAMQIMEMFPLFKDYRISEVTGVAADPGSPVSIPAEEVSAQEKLAIYQLIDVREEQDKEEESIPGAIQMTLREMPSRLRELSKDEGYLLYCAAGFVSRYACEYLLERGYQAYNLSGGIRAWKEEQKKK